MTLTLTGSGNATLDVEMRYPGPGVESHAVPGRSIARSDVLVDIPVVLSVSDA
jgi:hypothetical protein